MRSIAFRTASTETGETCGFLLITRETVAIETPASLETSKIDMVMDGSNRCTELYTLIISIVAPN